ncbi:hypothetical protein PENTCL1PPCAC_11737, partial [Pristionchus entomophagus]
IIFNLSRLNFFLTSIFLGLIDTADFMFIMETNFAHYVLLYTAVIHPFIYANYLTFRHCVGVGISLVFLASLQGAVIGMGCSILLFPSSSPIKCPIETCQYPISLSILYIIIGDYLLMLLMYIIVLWRLK